eukprot:CAMPEP_0197516960 /NCGR_PEP_ID=MMETSP1318-20131121/1917_1 /TAXON_ID=552666 /ORGANISM="Partenskyella glossopodia, Strain RCC365" /LENGTH=268 /DNA_ID=CAMNT_0043066143 /DNA_START=195 /DNA_END=1000 /DNA_ORIENTATION=-
MPGFGMRDTVDCLRVRADDDDFDTASFAREVAKRRGETTTESSSSSSSSPPPPPPSTTTTTTTTTPTTKQQRADAASLIQTSIDASPPPRAPPAGARPASAPQPLNKDTARERVFRRKPSPSSTETEAKPTPNWAKPPEAPRYRPPPPPSYKAPPPPIGARSAQKANEKKKNGPPSWTKWLNFDFTDPDWGKAKKTAGIEGEGNILERSIELAKLFVGFSASFWQLGAVTLALIGLVYFGVGSGFVHGGASSSSNVPRVTVDEILKDL